MYCENPSILMGSLVIYLFIFLGFVFQACQTDEIWICDALMLLPATLLKVILHGCFSRCLNCTNGTKSRKASHMFHIWRVPAKGSLTDRILLGCIFVKCQSFHVHFKIQVEKVSHCFIFQKRLIILFWKTLIAQHNSNFLQYVFPLKFKNFASC